MCVCYCIPDKWLLCWISRVYTCTCTCTCTCTYGSGVSNWSIFLIGLFVYVEWCEWLIEQIEWEFDVSNHGNATTRSEEITRGSGDCCQVYCQEGENASVQTFSWHETVIISKHDCTANIRAISGARQGQSCYLVIVMCISEYRWREKLIDTPLTFPV